MRRELAHKIGVDPYTSNPLISGRLDDLSKAAYAGGVSLDVAFTVATGGAAAAVSFTKTVSNLAWQLPPEDIRARNHKDLAAMDVSQSTRDAFLGNDSFTPTLALAYVAALKALGVKAGAGDLTQLAAGAESETEARFYIDQLRMAAVYNKQGGRIDKLGVAGQVGVMHAGTTLFVPDAVDYLSWTDGISRRSRRPLWNRVRMHGQRGCVTWRARKDLRKEAGRFASTHSQSMILTYHTSR